MSQMPSNCPAVVFGRPEILSAEWDDSPALSPDMDRLATWMTMMEVTRPDVLRATHCHRLLQRFGHVLRKPRSKNFYEWSFVVHEIDQFLSHSWHGNHVRKAMILILIKNGLHACILGTLAALFMSVLVFFHHLPDIPRLAIFQTDSAERTSIWSLTTGMLVSSATLLLRRPQQTVFLDNICIDQSSELSKAEGILNVGAFLRRSNSMLVLWDSSYVERLWCMFEIAGFLHSRELREGTEGTESKIPRLDIRPIWAAPCTVAIAVSLFGAMLALLIAPFSNPIIGSSIFGVLAVTCFHVAAESVRNYNRCIDKLQFELKSFDMQKAQCYCCSVNHVSSSGPDLVCDREIIGQCISNWFDSMLNFNECVRSTVFANLIEQLLHRPFPAWWLIGASIPILWGQLDAVAVQLRLGHVDLAIAWSINGLMWWLSGFPVSFLCWSAFCRSWRARTHCDWLVNFVGTCIVVGVMCLLWTINSALTLWMANDVLGSAVFLVIMLVISCLLWNFGRWPLQRQGRASEHHIS